MEDWDIELNSVLDALREQEIPFAEDMVVRILSDLEEAERRGDDVSKIRGKTGLEVLKALVIADADFVDHSVTPEMIAEDYREGRAEKGVVPFQADMSKHLDVLKKAVQESDGTERYKAGALSIGGTNTILGAAAISGKGKIEVSEVARGKFENKLYETASEFWKAVLPGDYAKILCDNVDEDGELSLGVTIAHPVVDGFLRPGKYNCLELIDGSITVEDSLKDFISDQGIAPREKINIVISPNDTVSTLLAHFGEFDKYEGKLRCSLILGTGANVYLKGWVTEMGDYIGFKPSELDKLQPTAEGVVTIDHLVAGSKIGDTFKYAVSAMFDKDSLVSREIQKLSKEEAAILMFELVYNDNPKLPEGTDSFDGVFLKTLARKFVDRSAYYVVNMLKGLTMDIEEEVVLFVDGSVITKNPKFLAEINDGLKDSGVTLVFSELDVSGEGAETVLDNSSFGGTMVLAMAEKLLKKAV